MATSDSAKVKWALEQEFELEIKSDLLEPIAMRHELAIVSLIGDGMHPQRGGGAFLPSVSAGKRLHYRYRPGSSSARFRL